MYSEAGVHHAPVVESVFASRRRARADAEQRTDEKIGPRGGPRRGCTMAWPRRAGARGRGRMAAGPVMRRGMLCGAPDSRPPLNRTTSGGGSLPRPHPFLVVCGAVNFNWHTYVWVLRSHRCPIAHTITYERTARARASKTCVRPAQARESAQQLQYNVSVRHRHATRHCCGRLLLREQHRSHRRDSCALPPQ